MIRATTPTPTVTPAPPTTTPLPSPTPVPEPTATPVPLPPSFNACQEDPNKDLAPNFPIAIGAIDKEAEVVELQNVSGVPIELEGWTMCSIRGNQTHEGIGDQGSVVMQPGAVSRFDYLGEGTIWRNDLCDNGALYDPEGSLVSYWVDEDSCSNARR